MEMGSQIQAPVGEQSSSFPLTVVLLRIYRGVGILWKLLLSHSFLKKMNVDDKIIRQKYIRVGAAVAQLVEALRYKPKARGFDSRWCLWIFSLA
jgi:hypothetical protein